MARIPEGQIERVKRETDLVALIRSRGIELTRHGARDFAGRCPFHEDEHHSLIVNTEKGLYHCMGCGLWASKESNASRRGSNGDCSASLLEKTTIRSFRSKRGISIS